MKKKTAYRTAPKDISSAISSAVIIRDFLPSPEDLIKKEDTVKVTITLSKKSILFFKQKAKKMGVPYQSMIKTVLDKYTTYYQEK